MLEIGEPGARLKPVPSKPISGGVNYQKTVVFINFVKELLYQKERGGARPLKLNYEANDGGVPAPAVLWLPKVCDFKYMLASAGTDQ